MLLLEWVHAEAEKKNKPVLVIRDIPRCKSCTDEAVLMERCAPLFKGFPRWWEVWKPSRFEIVLLLEDGRLIWNLGRPEEIVEIYRSKHIRSVHALEREIVDELTGLRLYYALG